MGNLTNENISSLRKGLSNVLLDKGETVDDVLVALLAKGHVLLEDVPGVGKTVLVKGLAKLLGIKFKRIQFTPDLLPSDVTGISIYNQKIGDFEYKPGPIMANIILADEINRTSPKTQSSLLEAMEESQVTIDGETYSLPEPFLVFATQNPIEYEGTYSLPEAQLDRFLMKCNIGYPSFDGERDIVLSQIDGVHPLEKLEPSVNMEGLKELQQEVTKVRVSQPLLDYIIEIIRATRIHPAVQLGSSPRGALALTKAAKAKAFLEGRDYIIPDDVKDIGLKVLSHRIIIKPEEVIQGITNEDVIKEVFGQVEVPVGK
ncbi:MoxR family ATPase [Alkalicella caledoniensis]|uniref:MoxR family ATPase n=1 Tax=Alkalicella caledoniensis TaxID=2731377 RepID=A0A7G9W963_ALKCA|nr:MoxR family ATPase [Alkalicella caledoniensis]QNO15225.1 MoxR family ATPase [Alkalicella caledoniensis]